MSTSLRQQSFFASLNNQLRRQRAYFNSWNNAFYNSLEWEIYPGVTFPLNYRRSTKIFLDRNNIETYTGYTSSNGDPLSGDPSVSFTKLNPEYFKINVKSGPALYIQEDSGERKAIFYIDLTLDNDKFSVDYQTGDIYTARDITADRHITTTDGNVYVQSGFIDVINPGSDPGVKITQTGTGDAFLVYDINSDTTPFVIDDTGKTGISTSSPAASLDVRGTNSQIVLAVNSNNADADFQFGSTTTDNMLFGDAITSRIGINKNTPLGSLDIQGTASVSALIVNANNADSDFQFGSTTSDFMLFGDASTSRIGINKALPTGTVDVQGTAGISALVVNANNTDSNFQFGSQVTDYMLFGDASTSRIGINIVNPTGTLEISGSQNVSVLIANTNNADSDFQFGSTSTDNMLFGDASTSRIGINKNAPLGTLDIQGTASVSALIVNANNTNSDFQFGSENTDYMLFGDASTSRVGINTPSPTGTLDILGTAGVSDLVVNANNTDSDFQFGSQVTDYLLFGDASTSRVGINMVNPTGTLDISGSQNVSVLIVNSNNADADFQFGSVNNDNLLYGDAGNNRIGIRTSTPTGTLEIGPLGGAPSLVVNAVNSDSDFQFGSLSTDFLLYGDAGDNRVGINTNTPTATFSVVGSANVSDNFAVDGNTLFVRADTNRVGIGTSNPNQALTVVGSISSTDTTITRTYTITGQVSSTASADLTVDASVASRVRWVGSICASNGYALNVSNLTNGREIFAYIKNTAPTCGTSTRLTIKASTTTSGFTDVECSNNGSGVRSYIDLNTNGGSATIWVANIGGNIVGAIY